MCCIYYFESPWKQQHVLWQDRNMRGAVSDAAFSSSSSLLSSLFCAGACTWKKQGLEAEVHTILRCQRRRRHKSILRSFRWNCIVKSGAYSQPSATSAFNFS